MPYVNELIRRQVKAPLEGLIEYVHAQEPSQQDGTLNYIISELVSRSIKPSSGWRYHLIHRAYGVFQAAGAEFYRRIAAPYEDKAIENNGDIIAYVHPQEKAGDRSADDEGVDKLLR